MAGNLSQMALDWAVAMASPFPSGGLTSPLRVKTSIRWNSKRLISNSSHALSYNWECAGLGLALNTIVLESPTLSVFTDPVMQFTCNLVEFQGVLPTFGTPYSFRCTGLTIAWAVALITPPIKIWLYNQDDSNDAILIFED